MSRIPLRFWVLAAVLGLLNVGGLLWIRAELVAGQRRAHIVAALPTHDADLADRLALVFDQPCVTAGAVGQALARAPFTVSPALNGRWVWAAPERLEFRLEKPLPPGRVYVLRPAPDAETVLGRRLAGETEFRFQTRALELLACEFVAADRTHATFALHFNQPVNPADLLRLMQVTDPGRGRKLATTTLTAEPAERLVVRTLRPRRDEIEVRLDERLAGAGAELPLGAAVVRRVQVVPAFALLRADVERPSLEQELDVTLYFSRELDVMQNLPSVNVSPLIEGLRARLTSGRLVITGRFECARRYTAAVPGTLLSKEGETLGDAQTASFEVPDREPGLSFTAGDGILSPAGNQAVEVKLVNLDALRLRADRLHANNLVAALHSTHHLGSTHRQLPEKIVPLNAPQNTPTQVLVDLRGLIDQPCGVFHIEATAADRGWPSDAAVITLTDLGLTVKSARGGVLAWVTSLRTAQPVAGVTVTALSQNNQVLAQGTTDSEGIVRLAVPEKHPDGPVWVITAERGGDLAFVRPDERPWVLDDVDQSGRSAPLTYDVLLYAERGVFRPGDTVHLTGIVRDVAGQVPPVFPLVLRVTRPDGRKVAESPLKFEPTSQGVFHCDYTTRADAQLGRYRYTVHLPGAEEVLGQTKTLVEEFVPVRLAVAAQSVQPRFGPGEKPRIRVQARYLFDQPAAGLPLTVTSEFRRIPFRSARFPLFTFGDETHKESWKAPELKTELDGDGHAEVDLPPPDSSIHGLWQAELAASVTEPGGRSTATDVTVVVDTADRHIGLRLPAGNLVTPDSAAQAEWVLVNGTDEPLPATLEFDLARIEYDSVLEIVNQRPVWKSVERAVPVWKQQAGTPGNEPAPLALNVKDPGRYRIRVTDPDTKGTAALEFYVTADPAEAQTLALDRPERLEVVLDQAAYVPGSTAKVLIRSPLPGTLLLTLESDRVLDQRVVFVPGSTAEIELPVPRALRGGAFVSATLVRAIDPAQEKWLPHRAIGLARLMTDHEARNLPVSISAPSSARPGATVTVRVAAGSGLQPIPTAIGPFEDMPSIWPLETQPIASAGGTDSTPAVVHLWVVDEGILRTTAYAPPNPRAHFFGQRELEVASADVFGDLLPDYRRPTGMAHIGGDGGEEEELRRSPVPARRQAPAVLWRTSAPVGPDGTLTVALDLPKLTGGLRLMAVAVDGDKYGAAQRPVTLTTPLLLEASWPRFVAPKDRFQVPVKLFNSSAAPLAVALELTADGPLKVELSEDQRRITVEPGKPSTVWLDVSAAALGVADVTVTARATTAEGEALTETSVASLPVRPIAPLQAETQFLRVEAGRETTIDLPGDYLPGTGRATLTVSAQPQVELLPAVEQLLEYPYGCVEQTTSRLYALLYAPELLAERSEGTTCIQQVRDMIDAGLLRLWSMQTRDGGLSYWPGGQHSDLWPSAYVGEFLLAAQRAGHKPEPRFVEELLKYLKAQLYAPEERDADDRRSGDNTRALICRVLAGFGQPQEGWQTRLGERLEHLDMAGRAALAAAWLETGRRDRALAALPPDTVELLIASSTGGRITSQVQQQATLLGVLLDLDHQHPWIPVLVRKLETARTGGRWANTLENATALSALARYQLVGLHPGTFSGQFLVGNQPGSAFDSAAPATAHFAMSGEPVKLTSTGDGNIFVAVQTRGLASRGNLAPFDRQIQVRRHWTDRAGERIDPAALRVGDLIYVQVTLAAPGLDQGDFIENIAVVDALPGGLEIENPELATAVHVRGEPAPEDRPDRAEFRDDRTILFTSAQTREQTFRYVLRVITIGRFAIPPIEASCMYDPAIASRHGGGVLEVQR